MERNESEKKIVLLGNHDIQTQRLMTRILESDYVVYSAMTGVETLAMIYQTIPDIIILDLVMPDMSGNDILKKMKSTPATRDIPVLMISGVADEEAEEAAFILGAADFLTKPFRATTIKMRVFRQLLIASEMGRLRCLSMTDTLTGTANRRAFDERLMLEWNRGRRLKASLSLLMIDIDDFKRFNDTYGHLQGDIVLTELAQRLDAIIGRSTDLVARFGGEEFVVLLPDTNLYGAIVLAERVRLSVEQLLIPSISQNVGNLKVTVSIGAAGFVPGRDDDCKSLISNADEQLYIAKQNGKNRVCPWLDAEMY